MERPNREGMKRTEQIPSRRVQHAGCRWSRPFTRPRRSLERKVGQRSVSDVERPNDRRSYNRPEAERSHGGGPCRSFDHVGLERRRRATARLMIPLANRLTKIFLLSALTSRCWYLCWYWSGSST